MLGRAYFKLGNLKEAETNFVQVSHYDFRSVDFRRNYLRDGIKTDCLPMLRKERSDETTKELEEFLSKNDKT